MRGPRNSRQPRWTMKLDEASTCLITSISSTTTQFMYGSSIHHLQETFPIISHLTALMSQFPLIPTPSSYQTIFDNALEQYKKKTGEDLLSHPLYAKLESCHFPTAIPTVLRQQLLALHQSGTDEDSLAKLLHSTVNVISAFSATIGGSIGLVSLRKGWLHALYPNT